MGDLIGKYLFEKITGKIAKHKYPTNTKNDVYLTVGSIISDKNLGANVIIWGSGLSVPKLLNTNYKNICYVRGKQTRNYLLSKDMKCPDILGDPGLLLPRFYDNKKKIEYELGIILHYIHNDKDVEDFCSKIQVKYKIIYTNIPVEEFIDEICECEYILSSSLHDIIVAHAYEKKAIPFYINTKLLSGGNFKFNDYYSIYTDNEIKYININDLGENIFDKINNFFQPNFPINTTQIYDSYPFLPEKNII